MFEIERKIWERIEKDKTPPTKESSEKERSSPRRNVRILGRNSIYLAFKNGGVLYL